MAALFTKADDGTYLTYAGIGEALGRSYVIKKDDTALDLHVIIPIAGQPSPAQTWQDLSADLDLHI